MIWKRTEPPSNRNFNRSTYTDRPIEDKPKGGFMEFVEKYKITKPKFYIGCVCLAVLIVVCAVWLIGSRNPVTPAGYVGYLVKGAVFGQERFYGMQTGPASSSRTWLLHVVNVSITPYKYDESMQVLARDNLDITFSVHLVFKVKKDEVRSFVENYSTLTADKNPDVIIRSAYINFIQAPLRNYARDEIQKLNGLDVKEKITVINDILSVKTKELCKNTPFDIIQVVVGNIQYPAVVTTAVSTKMATTQLLEQKNSEVDIEKKEAEKRIIQAGGIARSMEIINAKLTSQYLQHEAIDAQKAMVGSPNHTTIYIPVGPMGVPVVHTTK